MKTVLWATLSANGNYAQSGPENPPNQEALNDFVANAKTAGNFIVGRRTYEGMLASGGVSDGPLADLDVVVVSNHVKHLPGATTVGSPQEALSFLLQKGYETALIGAGAELHNEFLGQGLVDELIFNIAPVLEGKGLNLLLDQEKYKYKDIQLLDFKPLGGGVIQLRYAVDR